MAVVNYKIFSNFINIAHFYTTRNGGVSVGNFSSFNFSPYSGDNFKNQKQNLKILSKQLDIEPEQIIFPNQTHETVVKNIDEKYFTLNECAKKEYLNRVDALVTNLKGLCIGVITADCVPLVMYDSVNQAIGVAHAGWRGTCGKIASLTVEEMSRQFGTKARNIYTAIGPSISRKAYCVGSEVIDAFRLANFPINEISTFENSIFYLDLWKANQWVLQQSGVPTAQIEITGICTFTEHENYFSARRLGINSGRMLSGIMLK